jgi:hypothetical protein
MTEDVTELLKKALALSPEARAYALAQLESLTRPWTLAEEAWSQEIARRIATSTPAK